MKVLKLLLITALTATTIFAAKPASIGTGSPTGNYFSMTNDVFSENYCGDIMPNGVEIHNTDGSVDNLTGLTNKKYSIGIVQSDVLMNMSKTMPRKVNQNSIKILAGLHVETIHLLIPKGYAPKKSGGMFSKLSSAFSSKSNEPISLQALKDQRISSWGGSIVSARALSYFFNLNWKINAISADVATKTNTPIILVGGQPYAPVEKLLATGNWKLLSMNYNEIQSRAPFYMRSEATYKVNGNPITVSTVGVQALLVGKSFRKEARNESMINLATCIDQSLADFADDTDTNPNWVSVYENNENGNQMNWNYFKIK